jgi:hypothetical protein
MDNLQDHIAWALCAYGEKDFSVTNLENYQEYFIRGASGNFLDEQHEKLRKQFCCQERKSGQSILDFVQEKKRLGYEMMKAGFVLGDADIVDAIKKNFGPRPEHLFAPKYVNVRNMFDQLFGPTCIKKTSTEIETAVRITEQVCLKRKPEHIKSSGDVYYNKKSNRVTNRVMIRLDGNVACMFDFDSYMHVHQYINMCTHAP